MKKYVLLFIIITTPAFAQPVQQNQQPVEQQALSEKLIEEFNMNLRCRTALITDQKELRKLQEENASLKKQLEKEKK